MTLLPRLCGLWRNWVLPLGPSVGMLLLHSSTTFWTYHSGACLSLPWTYHRGTCPSLSVQHPGPTIRVLVFHYQCSPQDRQLGTCPLLPMQHPGPTIRGTCPSLPWTLHRGTCLLLPMQHPGPTMRILVHHYQCNTLDLP